MSWSFSEIHLSQKLWVWVIFKLSALLETSLSTTSSSCWVVNHEFKLKENETEGLRFIFETLKALQCSEYSSFSSSKASAETKIRYSLAETCQQIRNTSNAGCPQFKFTKVHCPPSQIGKAQRLLCIARANWLYRTALRARPRGHGRSKVAQAVERRRTKVEILTLVASCREATGKLAGRQEDYWTMVDSDITATLQWLGSSGFEWRNSV